MGSPHREISRLLRRLPQPCRRNVAEIEGVRDRGPARLVAGCARPAKKRLAELAASLIHLICTIPLQLVLPNVAEASVQINELVDAVTATDSHSCSCALLNRRISFRNEMLASDFGRCLETRGPTVGSRRRESVLPYVSGSRIRGRRGSEPGLSVQQLQRN